MTAIDPRISAAAKAVQAAGWRVTSILRPDSTSHAHGIAFDAAPWRMAISNWGWNTAAAVLRVVAAAVPNARFLVVSEGDHAHIELLGNSAWPADPYPHGLGVQDKDGTSVRRARIMSERIYTDVDGEYSDHVLPDGPVGDPFGADDDYVDEYGDPFDLETGAPRRKRHRSKSKARASNPVSRAKALGRVAAGLTSSNPRVRDQAHAQASKLARTNPAAAKELQQAQVVRAMTKRATPPFVQVLSGLQLVSSTFGPDAKLREADAVAAITEIMTAEPFSPQVFPLAPSGANLAVDVDAALCVANGGPLAVGQDYKWVGCILDISGSLMNKEPGKKFTIAISTASGEVAQHTLTLGGDSTASVIIYNGKLSGGKSRLLSRSVAAAAVATGDYSVTISGLLNTAYSATLRFLVPGDKEVEHLLTQLGA